MGLTILPYIEVILKERKKIVDFYNYFIDFSYVKTFKLRENTKWNYSYYPVIFESEKQLLSVQKSLNENNIFPRRYFYPSLNTLNYVGLCQMPISESISKRILCLPLYVGLNISDVNKIVKMINS
jgi:dTDP-4-amino-4,6-dideoxygalactose transaminase